MLSHTRMGVPYEYMHMGRPIRVWAIPYAYGPIYAYMGQNTYTRQYHQNHFILPQAEATLNTYKYRFYPRTIKEWNNLPINVIE